MTTDTGSFGARLRNAVADRAPVSAIGVHDIFSAAIAARHYDALFVSGFSFAASHYGLPDIGFIAWPDIVDFVRRIRTVVPDRHVVVDIDDGYGDDEVAAHVVRSLEDSGASAVVMEDQRRPRRCGHLDGKLLQPLDDYLRRLDAVTSARRELFVVARTDAAEPDEIDRRVRAFADSGADAILIDGLRDVALLKQYADDTGKPLVFNQLAGGKSPRMSTTDLAAHGVSLVLYSTVTLFAAQRAVESALTELRTGDGRLDAVTRSVVLDDCVALLEGNHRNSIKRDSAQ